MEDAALIAHADRVLEDHVPVRLQRDVVADHLRHRVLRHRDAADQDRRVGLVDVEDRGERIDHAARDRLEIERRLAELVLAEHPGQRAVGGELHRDAARERRRLLVLLGIDDEVERHVVEELVAAVDLHGRLAGAVVEVLDRPLDRHVEIAQPHVGQLDAERGLAGLAGDPVILALGLDRQGQAGGRRGRRLHAVAGVDADLERAGRRDVLRIRPARRGRQTEGQERAGGDAHRELLHPWEKMNG